MNGTYLCCKHVAKVLVDQGEGGKIVNISSLAGQDGQPQYGGCTPSKFAVVGLTQALAKELAPHKVNVNCIAPGSTDTDMMDGTFRRTGERMGIPFEAVKVFVKSVIRESRLRSRRWLPTSAHRRRTTSPARRSASTVAW